MKYGMRGYYTPHAKTKEHGTRRVGGTREKKSTRSHKLTAVGLRERGDVPRIERLVESSCCVEHCISHALDSRENKKRIRMANEGEIRMEDIDETP